MRWLSCGGGAAAARRGWGPPCGGGGRRGMGGALRVAGAAVEQVEDLAVCLAGGLGELAAGGPAALDGATAEERHLERAGGRAHAVRPAGDLVVGRGGAGD